MTAMDNNPVRQYEHRQAQRDSIATQETAVGLHEDPALAEFQKEIRPDPENQAWPWLKWQDKDEAPTTYGGGLYIQEKISPARIISTLLRDPAAQQRNWFADFNNLPPDAHYEPYVHHAGKWSNRLIRGASQRVMASLLEKESYKNQVDLVYMDPPYNIKFNSNFQLTTDDTEVGDDYDQAPKSAREIKAFRDTYRNGTHSYLSQLRVNALLAKELLKESGSFVLQIGPDNLHYAACLLDEVFGHENHVATVPYMTATNQAKYLAEYGNWLLWYSKDLDTMKYRQIHIPESITDRVQRRKHRIQTNDLEGNPRPLTNDEISNPEKTVGESALFETIGVSSKHPSETGRSDTYYHHPKNQPCPGHGWPNHVRQVAKTKSCNKADHYHPSTETCEYPIPNDWEDHTCTAQCHNANTNRLCPKGRRCGPDCHSNACPCPTGRQWSVSLSGLHSIACDANRMVFKEDNVRWRNYLNEHPGRTLSANFGNIGAPTNKRYVVETPSTVLETILLMATDPGDLVLDPTCGSGAMPFQCEKWGRRWVAIDTSSISIAIARERIATAVHPYHLLKDSPEGHRLDHELEQQLKPEAERLPFQAKPDGYRHDPSLGFVNERQLRVSAKTLAYGPDYSNPKDIIRHQDRTEKAKGLSRASSAFTVESDLPTALSVYALETETAVARDDSAAVRKNLTEALQTSGIHVAGQTEPYRVHNLEEAIGIPGATHTGEITEPDSDTKGSALFYLCQEDEIASDNAAANLAVTARQRKDRYAVVIGFDHQGNLNAIARSQGSGMTLLVVDASRDLTLTDVANKPADRSFIVISEPEYQVHQEPYGQVSIEITGLVCYNPRSGAVEQTDDRKIAALLTDTAYDQQSFRTALFNLPGAKEDNLKQLHNAFKRQISPEKWERMKSRRTLPFDPPARDGRVAVKVIDNTGVEHLFVLTAEELKQK